MAFEGGRMGCAWGTHEVHEEPGNEATGIVLSGSTLSNITSLL